MLITKKIPKISKIFIRMFKNDKAKSLIWESVQNTSFNRNLIITKSLEDREVFVHNGKFVEQLNIKLNMAGFRLGDFLFTKVTGREVTSRKKAKLLKKRMKKKKK